MFTDARELETGTTLEVDLCVVGAGAAGLAVTLELLDSSCSIAVVESGGRGPSDRTQQLAAGRARGRLFGRNNRYLSATRTRAFGGLGEDWHGSCRALDPEDLIVRSWVPASGWPIDAATLDPYNARARSLFGIDVPARRDERTGLLAADDAFESSWLDYSPRPSIAERFRGRFAQAGNVNVLTHANVVEIALDEGGRRVVDLVTRCLDGPELVVRARYFVLAAGALENARLLLASNGQRPHGIGNENDLVGRFFMEQVEMRAAYVALPGQRRAMAGYDAVQAGDGGLHPVRAIMRPSARLQARHELLNSLITFSPVAAADIGELASHVGRLAAATARLDSDSTPDAAAEPYFGAVTLRSEQPPERRSRLVLGAERDELGVPRIDLAWRFDDHVVWSLRTTARLLGENLGRRLLGRLQLRATGRVNRRRFRWSAHQSGTTRMSREPSEGVIDTDCRLHDVSNLFVAGSSVFPTSGCSGPMLTVVALSLRLGEHLRRLLASP
ncbi:MAG: GMC family oxidoreductase [Acidobacteria bacterium]|nr:GMC family oxidoreductase [Acidobacteriota bacterium]